MKSLTFLASTLAAAPLLAAVPVIDTSSVSVQQGPGKTVVIDYTMNPASSGDTELAIVTVDILTNAVGGVATSVGGEHLTTLSGDVNKIVAHTQDYKHKILWEPTKEGFPEFKLPAEQVAAKITLWATNAPPAYWVIDLTQPANRMADRYYPEAGQIPGTVTNDLYKTNRLVFRRIPAKGVTWKMGNGATGCPYHYVTFSYDYYMAVFELTKMQAKNLGQAYDVGTAMTPQLATWSAFRVNAWPQNGHSSPGAESWLGKRYRSALGGIEVDMPTRSEWEFACRAGTSTTYNNGTSDATGLDKVGWYSGNSGGVFHDVGLKDPNNWGLYDMHGNAMEWVLDWYSAGSTSPVWDPVGPSSGETKLRMGGWKGGSAEDCSTFGTARDKPNTSSDRCTIRLTVIIP